MRIRASRPPIVISEPDLKAALHHLRSLPHPTPILPRWERTFFLNMLRDAIGKRPKSGQCYPVAPGVLALIQPFGSDLARLGQGDLDHDGRLQVWLAIRSCGTDPTHLTELV